MVGQVINQYKKFKPIPATKNICYHFLTRERKKSFGSANPDKTFYVIRGVDDSSPLYIGVTLNLLANYFYVLSHLKYAQDNGWIPIVDQLNYPVYNSTCGKMNGTKNAWEYFWEQPAEYILEDVYKSRNVILSKRSWFSNQEDMGYEAESHTDREKISHYHKLGESITLKKHVADYINATRGRLFDPEDRVLGVSYRFDGHAKDSPLHGPGHPISPAVETLIELVFKRFKQWDMTRVFLASDEESSVEKFKAVFGERLATVPRKRTNPSVVYDESNVNPIYSAENIYNTTRDYLAEIEILAGCVGLIGSVTSGLKYAVVRNNNAYEHVEIVDCGRFVDLNKRDLKQKVDIK